MLTRTIGLLAVAACVAMFLRLGGAAPTLLPPAPISAAALLATLAVRAAVDRRRRGLAVLPVEGQGFAIGLTLVASVGLVIRLASIGADLGHQPLDIDEHRVAANVKAFFVSGDIGYHTVEHYPGLHFWLLTGTSLLVYLRGLMEGLFATVHGMPLEQFVLAGRLTSVALGTATTVLVALIGRQMAGSAAGLVASALFAIAPLAVQTTTALRNDPAQVLFVCAAAHAALASGLSDRVRWPLLGGLYAGLATAVKYTSVFALAPVLLAVLLGPRERLSRGVYAAGAFLVALLVTNHFLWWDFPNFVRQLSDQVGITGAGHWGALENPAAFHTSVLQRSGVGWVGLAAAVGFGVHGLVTGRRQAWVFWLFPLLYIWFTTKRPSQFPRWVFPMLPFIVVAASAGLVGTLAALRSWRPRLLAGRAWAAPAVAGLVAGAVLVQPLWGGARAASRRFTEPTQAKVERWIASRPAGERVLLGQYWLNVDGEASVSRARDLGEMIDGSIYRLAAFDWVVVPEPLFRRPGLKALAFAERVSADHWSFGGNLGYDFEIYAPPKLPSTPGPIDFDFSRRDVDQFLGPEWDAPDAQRGRRVPSGGATLYIPPMPRSSATLTLDIAGPVNQPALVVTDAEGPVPFPELTTPPPQQVRLPVRLARDGRSTELRLAPGRRNSEVTVLRIRVE